MPVREPGLERSARRFDAWGVKLIGFAVALAVVGIVIWLIGRGTVDWVQGLGGMIAWVAVAPAAVGVGLLCASVVSHWSSRHKPFA